MAGYEAFATKIGLHQGYARKMFKWIGEIPKDGSDKDRKTIIDFYDKDAANKVLDSSNRHTIDNMVLSIEKKKNVF